MFKQKLKVLGLLPILSLLILSIFVTPIKAAQFEEGDYTLEQSEIIEENLYISEAQSVTISGVIDGDLFVCTNALTISGTITGDVYAISDTLNVSGNIYGSAYLAAQRVDISGTIAQSATIVAMFSDVSGTLGKDLMVFAYDSNISGRVMEDARIFATASIISGTVKGESLIYASSSTIDEDLAEGEIYENLVTRTTTGERWNISNLSILVSNININLAGTAKRGLLSINISSTIISFVAMYIVGVLLIYLAPVKTLKIEKKINTSIQEFLYSFLIGLGITLLLPLPLIVFSFTLVGTPLALVIGAGLIFVWIFGKLWVESALGYSILKSVDKKDDKRLLSLLVGRGLTTVINFIPLVRTLYKWVLGTVAVGAVVRVKYDCFKTKKITKKVVTKKTKTKKKGSKKK